jgi:hypothetical protein
MHTRAALGHDRFDVRPQRAVQQMRRCGWMLGRRGHAAPGSPPPWLGWRRSVNPTLRARSAGRSEEGIKAPTLRDPTLGSRVFRCPDPDSRAGSG